MTGLKISTTYVECGCSRRYTPDEAAKLKRLGIQKIEGEPSILLFNCVCGSTLAMEVPA